MIFLNGSNDFYGDRVKTRIRMRELSRVFGSKPGEMAHAYMARLAVLYEDLRIETSAIYLQSAELDITDEKYRRNYFLRRSIGTLVEFAETIRLLEDCPEFQSLKSSYPQCDMKIGGSIPTFGSMPLAIGTIF